ncbi:MAG: hypothetical protein OEQ13_03265 [Acidobacteriota bacterium]|nr:hypothetical protein [Acidobacteriota bacterium]
MILALVLINAGWMSFDGSQALVVGDYLTPPSGPHAGQLGPWSMVAQAAGVEPRSTLMKSIFVVYGLGYFAMTALFLRGVRWAGPGLIVVAVLGLWHLPFGTLINIVVIALLLLPNLRGGS